MKGNILPSGPRAPADSQVYLAILVTLSCPLYFPLGMSAAITLPSSPWTDSVRRGWGVQDKTGRKVFMTSGQLPNTHLCGDEKTGSQPEVNDVSPFLRKRKNRHKKPHFHKKTLWVKNITLIKLDAFT